MLLSLLVACTTVLHVKATYPQAEVGIMRSGVRPHDDYLQAQIRGIGEASGRVTYSSFDHFWAWARVPGAKPTVMQVPTEISPGPVVGCVLGFVFWPAIASCFFVAKPDNALLVLEVRVPRPLDRPPQARIDLMLRRPGEVVTDDEL